MSAGGPNTWTQPLLGADGVPHLVLNGTAIELDLSSYDASQAEETGVFVETSGGQQLQHLLMESSKAPLSVPFEHAVETIQLSDEIRLQVLQAPAMAKVGALSFWLDRPAADFWEGDGSTTTWTLTYSTGYGSTGVTWAQRPARCWVGSTEQTMTTGSPSSGECQISQTADATQITLGAAPSAGAVIRFVYYPLFTQGTVEVEESKDGFNSGSLSLTFTERVPVRAY